MKRKIKSKAQAGKVLMKAPDDSYLWGNTDFNVLTPDQHPSAVIPTRPTVGDTSVNINNVRPMERRPNEVVSFGERKTGRYIDNPAVGAFNFLASGVTGIANAVSNNRLKNKEQQQLMESLTPGYDYNYDGQGLNNIPAYTKAGGKVKRGKKQAGGDQNDQMQKLAAQVAQKLQQGSNPDEVVQQLVKMGMPSDQAVQFVGSIVDQLKGGGQDQSQDQPQNSDQAMQAGGLPITPGLPSRKGANVEAEQGEVVQEGTGRIIKVSDQADRHEAGGVPLANVSRVLEDTSDKRKDKASKLLRIAPEEIKQLFDMNVKTPLSHSRAMERATEHYGKQEDKIKKVQQMVNEMTYPDKLAMKSAELNYKTLAEIPDPSDVFDALFMHQEKVKEINNIQDDGTMKAQIGKKVRTVPSKTKVTIDAPQPEQYDIPNTSAGRILVQNQPVDTSVNINPRFIKQPENKFYEPTTWADLATPVLGLVDSMNRDPELYNKVNVGKVNYKILDPTAALNANEADFNAGLDSLNTMGLPSGVNAAGVANLLGQKYKANNQISKQYDEFDAQTKNSEITYNQTADDRQSALDASTRGTFHRNVQLSREAQRQQKLKSIEDISRVIQMKRRQNKSGNLVLKLSPAFDQNGEYNGYQYLPMFDSSAGIESQYPVNPVKQKEPTTTKTIQYKGADGRTYTTQVKA